MGTGSVKRIFKILFEHRRNWEATFKGGGSNITAGMGGGMLGDLDGVAAGIAEGSSEQILISDLKMLHATSKISISSRETKAFYSN